MIYIWQLADEDDQTDFATLTVVYLGCHAGRCL
jgi:hypothetical protein